MNKISWRSLISITYLVMGVCTLPIASQTVPEPEDPPSYCVVNIRDMTDNQVEEILQGLHSTLAVEFSAQTLIPIRLFLKGDLIRLVNEEQSCGQIEVQQTFYAKCVGDELLLSTDLTEWKPFFEFLTGTAQVLWTLDEGNPSLAAGLEAYRRT